MLTTPKTVSQRYPQVRLWWSNYRQRDRLTGLLFVSPAVAYFLIFLFYPMLSAIYYSFTDWNLRSEPVWVGFQNYSMLFFDRLQYPYFWRSLHVTVQYVLFSVPISLATALVLALMIDSLRRGQDFFKVAFYLPVITADVAVATIWRWLYDPLYGLLNLALQAFGLPPQNWLWREELVIPALGIMAAWQCGGAVIIFLAGLKGIPSEMYEASAIDGAGSWQRFLYITLPLLRPTTFYLLVTGMIGAFQVFGLVYTLFGAGGGTLGGPNQAGLTYVLYIYQQATRYYKMGGANAMSVILLLVILIVTYLQFRFVPQKSE
jgi:multiple sugar transport system permease protein